MIDSMVQGHNNFENDEAPHDNKAFGYYQVLYGTTLVLVTLGEGYGAIQAGKTVANALRQNDIKQTIQDHNHESARLDAAQKAGITHEEQWADSVQMIAGNPVKTQVPKTFTIQDLKYKETEAAERASLQKMDGVDQAAGGISAAMTFALGGYLTVKLLGAYQYKALNALVEFCDAGGAFLAKKERQVRGLFGKKPQP